VRQSRLLLRGQPWDGVGQSKSGSRVSCCSPRVGNCSRVGKVVEPMALGLVQVHLLM
jgi:hypothetical protein